MKEVLKYIVLLLGVLTIFGCGQTSDSTGAGNMSSDDLYALQKIADGMKGMSSSTSSNVGVSSVSSVGFSSISIKTMSLPTTWQEEVDSWTDYETGETYEHWEKYKYSTTSNMNDSTRYIISITTANTFVSSCNMTMVGTRVISGNIYTTYINQYGDGDVTFIGGSESITLYFNDVDINIIQIFDSSVSEFTMTFDINYPFYLNYNSATYTGTFVRKVNENTINDDFVSNIYRDAELVGSITITSQNSVTIRDENGNVM